MLFYVLCNTFLQKYTLTPRLFKHMIIFQTQMTQDDAALYLFLLKKRAILRLLRLKNERYGFNEEPWLPTILPLKSKC